MPDATSSQRTIALGGRKIAYTVRRSQRAKQVGLRVGPAIGLEVVVPARGRLPDVPALLREKAAWIIATLDRMALAQPIDVPPLADGVLLPYQGVDHRLIVRAGPGLRPAGRRDEQARTLTISHDPAAYDLVAVLDWWYREEARAVLTARADAFAADLGVAYKRLTIRDGRSRWGSCSSAGGLNFSWRLILTPPAVLDYVVVHELAHLRELNHSPRFWALVAAHCPDYQLQRRWLKEHGAALMAVLKNGE
jgi:predicted metal-dependent hydrolase